MATAAGNHLYGVIGAVGIVVCRHCIRQQGSAMLHDQGPWIDGSVQRTGTSRTEVFGFDSCELRRAQGRSAISGKVE